MKMHQTVVTCLLHVLQLISNLSEMQSEMRQLVWQRGILYDITMMCWTRHKR